MQFSELHKWLLSYTHICNKYATTDPDSSFKQGETPLQETLSHFFNFFGGFCVHPTLFQTSADSSRIIAFKD